jgi:hypothetical protein
LTLFEFTVCEFPDGVVVIRHLDLYVF